MRKKSRIVTGSSMVAAGAVALSLAGAAAASGASAATAGTAKAPVATAARAAGAVNKNLYPFGMPQGGTAVTVPAPPGEPTLSPTITTKTTTRIYGADPFQEAVSVTQHEWPAVIPLNNPAENNNVPDRPWGLTLVTPDDPLTAISAVPLIHFPDDAPVLYVTKNGIPAITLNEIKRLGDTGISRFNNVDAFLVGAAANPTVESQLKSIGLKYYAITAPNVYELANKVDQVYGSIQNPDTGVPQMETSASTGGNGMQDVMIGAVNAYQYILPATHWVSHMPAGLLWVNKTGTLPAGTVTALKRRGGKAMIYVWGGPDQVSPQVIKELSAYGSVTRITNNDAVAFNANPPDTPVETAIAFAKMWDPAGMVGWKITGPGHGFTLVNVNDWPAAVASAPLSHLGFHAPLLLTNSPTSLPTQLDNYFTSVAPTFLNTPADGPYNMTYVVGSWNQVSWGTQAHVDYISEMGNRRVWSDNTGSGYTNSQPTG
jgi:hypothetical protein